MTNFISKSPERAPLTDREKQLLRELSAGEAPAHVSRRAQAVLLYFMSDLSLAEVADICDAHKNSVRNWVTDWREEGIDGLYDREGRGAKPMFTEAEERLILLYLEEEPRSLRQLVGLVAKRLGKTPSTATLRRILKKHDKCWKRMRKVPAKQPDEEVVERAKAEIAEFERQEREGNLDVGYFDEVGFSLQPSVPYAWQDKGRKGTCSLPSSSHRGRVNLLAFLIPVLHVLITFEHKGKVNSAVFIEIMDEFCRRVTKRTVVILDNASFHCSKEVQAKKEEWARHGVELYYLPPYSPELNLIEIVWRKIKYEWIPRWAYSSFDLLQQAIRLIIRQYGKEFDIKFS